MPGDLLVASPSIERRFIAPKRFRLRRSADDMEWHGRAKAGLIARCIDVSDVRAAIRAATDTRILSALRSGGHSLAGFSTCDRGLVIDLSRMREVTVDPDARRARVVVGCLLGSIDTNTQKTGLVFPRVSSPTPELLTHPWRRNGVAHAPIRSILRQCRMFCSCYG